MCFFGRSRSQPAPVPAPVAQPAATPAVDVNAEQDEQRRRMAAMDANTQDSMAAATAAPKTVLGG
jgi:hypothetical protein